MFAALAMVANAGWEDVGSPSASRRAAPARGASPVMVAPAAPARTVPAAVKTPEPAAWERSGAAAAPYSAPHATPPAPGGSSAPQTVREAARRRAAAREAEARAAAERERALIEAENRRIERRAAAARKAALEEDARAAAKRDGFYGGNAYSIPFFDATRATPSWWHFTYLTPAKAPNGNEISTGEAHAHFTVIDIQDMLGGDFSLSLDLSGMGFIDDADYTTLPYAFLDSCLDLQYVWRFVNDFSIELGVSPGIYGDPENFGADIFGYPFRGCLYYSLSPEFALRAGVEARPGWDRVIMPLAGIGWSPSDYWLFELGVPRSLVSLRLGPFDLYGTALWESTTYAMEDKEDKPEDMTIDDWRAGGGLAIHISDTFSLSAEAGYIFNREFKAEGSQGKGTIEVDDTPYFSFTLGSRF